ncbi:hypothetical protein [Curtobacterium sp. MCPF17_046]|uniref:hypothetical protein n=1 Tax=Curtobacterium sp. MCPF17_046 TaxID=2175663 RepID=UPI000D937F35|nr:hypothetical protein [Curtobacterium sp. MCPF17_046]PYY34485.1 hypothetical protein DEJ32_14860 [Curtobacterium sp. MCPF17_046]
MSAEPTDEQVHEERSESRTQLGVTSPYALFFSYSHPELQRRIEVTIAAVIGGNGWISLILINTSSEGSSLVVVIKWHPFAAGSRGLG